MSRSKGRSMSRSESRSPGRSKSRSEMPPGEHRRLAFLEQPASFFHDGDRPPRAAEVSDPYRRACSSSRGRPAAPSGHGCTRCSTATRREPSGATASRSATLCSALLALRHIGGFGVKIACVGGGPAGLYFALLLKRTDPACEVTVYERYPEGSTYGWGVTYWDELYASLRAIDPESARAIHDASVRWKTWVARVGDRPPARISHWDGGFGIGRSVLLRILADRARSLGVEIEYGREISGEEELAGCDLIVACDGVNSRLRERHAGHFGTAVTLGRNTYLWLGTTKAFGPFTFSFAETPHGWIWCYGYGYDPGHSTCVIECSPETWEGLGLHEATDADGLAMLEKLFADILDGHPLIGRDDTGESARWLNFRTVTNERWYHGNVVLMGDAAHTTHYSIGAGTALALGDAAYLVHALTTERDLPSALASYERGRQRTIRRAQKAARYSARWYENLPRYVSLPPDQLLALLGRRHSRVLPHVPPRLYYRFDRAVEHASSWWARITGRG